MSAATMRISQATRPQSGRLSHDERAATVIHRITNAACKHPTKFVSISAHSWLKEASPGLALPMRSSRFNMTAST